MRDGPLNVARRVDRLGMTGSNLVGISEVMGN